MPNLSKYFSKAAKAGAREADDILQGELSTALRQGAKLGDDAIDAEFRTIGNAADEIPINTDPSQLMLGDMSAAQKGINPYLLGGGAAVGGATALSLSQDGGAKSSPPMDLDRKPAVDPVTPVAAPTEKDPSISAIERLLKPTSPKMSTIDFGMNDTAGTVEGLREAQGQRDDSQLVNNLGRAAELIGSGISRSKPVAQQLFADQAKDADKYVKDFKDRQEQEKSDPSSAVSKGYREMMKRFGVNIKGEPSAATLEKIAPWLQKAYENDENRAMRKENLALALSAKQDAAKDKKSQKGHEAALRMAPKIQNKQYEKYMSLRTA